MLAAGRHDAGGDETLAAHVLHGLDIIFIGDKCLNILSDETDKLDVFHRLAVGLIALDGVHQSRGARGKHRFLGLLQSLDETGRRTGGLHGENFKLRSVLLDDFRQGVGVLILRSSEATRCDFESFRSLSVERNASQNSKGGDNVFQHEQSPW